MHHNLFASLFGLWLAGFCDRMSPSELLQREAHRQHLIETVRRLLPEWAKALFNELLEMK